jgi:hypothetical protein
VVEVVAKELGPSPALDDRRPTRATTSAASSEFALRRDGEMSATTSRRDPRCPIAEEILGEQELTRLG